MVAFTSSLDERLAVDSVVDALELRQVHGVTQPWPDQIEWLKALLAYVGRKDDVHLVVRVHPREGANKRESRVSQHLGRLREAFDKPFPNATFVWPGMDVSSYDLAELADIVLTAWTTLGLEVGRVAVPVLASTWSLSPKPKDDFYVWMPTPEAYFAKLEEMIPASPRLESVLHGFRWHYVAYFGHMVDFGDIIPARDFHGLPKFFMPNAAPDVVDVIVNRRDMLDINRERIEKAMGPGSLAAERAGVRAQLRRALRFLFTGEENSPDYRLLVAWTEDSPDQFLERTGLGSVPPGTALVLIHGKRMHFLEAGASRSRISAMGRRLAALGCDAAYGCPHPLPEEARAAGDARELVSASSGAAQSISGSVFESAFQRATRLKASGDHAGALKAVENALTAGVATPELLNLRGHLECLVGNPAAGAACFEQVVSGWPGFAMAHNNLTVLYWQQGDRKRALEQLARGLKADPYCKDLVGNAMRMFKDLGEGRQARAIGEYYLKKHPAESAWMESVLSDRD
jgi:tetratricopeptide (TPR) repeat protein